MKKTPQKSLIRLFAFMKPHMLYLVLCGLFTVVYTAATLYVPVVIGKALDYMVGAGKVDFPGITLMIIQLVACIVTVLIFQWLASVCSNRLAFNTIRDLRIAAFKKLNTVPLKYLDGNSHGDLMARIVSDADLVSDGLIQGFTHLFSGLVTVAGTIVFMFVINVKIALMVVILTPLSLLVTWLIAKLSHNMFRMQSKSRGELSGLSEEMLSNQKIVKAFAYESTAEEKFDVINADLKKYGTFAMFYSSLTNPSARFVNSVIYAAVAIFGALTVVSDPAAFSVGALSSFLQYANQYCKPFNEITGVITELQTAFASLRRVLTVLDEKEESSDAGKDEIKDCDGNMKAEHVYFAYNPEKPLITDFNIDVKKGQRIAIVGPTGCGKTTLINLLMRFYDTDSGTISVSGKNVNDVTRSSLRSCYGMVLQESWLFEGTIRENIAYGKEDATDEEIVEAAEKARIHKFIMRQKNGYDTMISEDGGNISQGQKQLLCIARILLSKPPMLILDEATSSIDTRTEKRVQKTFAEMMQGRTSFIIAHRLSTIVDADKILVMKDGNIIESGTHKELLAKQGFYSELFNSQFAKY